MAQPLPSRSPGTRPRRLAALAVVTGASLMFQVALTRLLATLLAYHFGFLAVSVSLVGVGAGGLLVYLWPQAFTGPRMPVTLWRWSLVNAVGLVVCPIIVVRMNLYQPYQEGGSPDLAFFLGLAGVCLAAAVPALASGVVVATAIRNAGSGIGAVYAADLLGAGAGALLAVPAMNLIDPPRLSVVLGVLVAIAAVVFGLDAGPEWRGRARGRRLGVGAVAVALVAVVLISDVTQPPADFFDRADTTIAGQEWNALSRVIGYRTEVGDKRGGQIVYDRAWAPVVDAAGATLPPGDRMGLAPQAMGFAFSRGGSALVIGGGGGRDIINALGSGVRSVDVIELNQAIRDIVDGPLADISGSPYRMPGVETTIGEGRSTLARRSKRYDQIHIGFTDTLSPDSAQGFALTENNLYTVEAFHEYFDHLGSDGILSVSRLTELVGKEAIRTTVLGLGALESYGIDDPEAHVVVLKGKDFLDADFATTLIRMRPWTEAELDRIRADAPRHGVSVLMAPGGPYADDWQALHDAASWRAFCNGYALDICPPTDDRPFFLNMRRRSSLFKTDYRVSTNDPVDTLVVTATILLLLSAIGFGLPVLMRRRNMQRPTVRNLAFFAALGFGFITLEVVLIQRFVLYLGFPTYALSVVLAGLLLATGAGSFSVGRWPALQDRLAWTMGAAVVLMVFAAFVMPSLLTATMDWPMWARVLTTMGFLAPLGFTMGTAMPTGLARLSETRPDSIPYAWAVNGLTSVVGSVVSVVIALYLGFRITTLVAAACYVVAVLTVPRRSTTIDLSTPAAEPVPIPVATPAD